MWYYSIKTWFSSAFRPLLLEALHSVNVCTRNTLLPDTIWSFSLRWRWPAPNNLIRFRIWWIWIQSWTIWSPSALIFPARISLLKEISVFSSLYSAWIWGRWCLFPVSVIECARCMDKYFQNIHNGGRRLSTKMTAQQPKHHIFFFKLKCKARCNFCRQAGMGRDWISYQKWSARRLTSDHFFFASDKLISATGRATSWKWHAWLNAGFLMILPFYKWGKNATKHLISYQCRRGEKNSKHPKMPGGNHMKPMKTMDSGWNRKRLLRKILQIHRDD